MKKLLLSLITFVCFIAFGLGIYSNLKTTPTSDLVRQNIEVLAQTKGGWNEMCFWRQVTCKKCRTDLEICDNEGDGYSCSPCGSLTHSCCK